MSIYRLSVIGKSGNVVDLYEVDCASDEAAYNKADMLKGSNLIDIRQGDRWIGMVDGRDPMRLALTKPHAPSSAPH